MRKALTEALKRNGYCATAKPTLPRMPNVPADVDLPGIGTAQFWGEAPSSGARYRQWHYVLNQRIYRVYTHKGQARGLQHRRA